MPVKKLVPVTRTAGAGHAAALPVAVGRAGVAVRGLPDSGVVMRMTRGRLWIGVLAGLLAGIVALNVISLSISSTSSRSAQQASLLERQNSELRARIAEQLSNGRMQAMAASLGLIVPGPDDITYLNASSGDARKAATVLAGGGFATPLLAGAGAPAPQTSSPSPSAQAHAAAPAPVSHAPAAPTKPAPSNSGGGGISAH